MLGLGLNPQVSAATSSFIIVWTSGIALFQFALSQMLNVEYAIITSVISTLGALIGVLGLKRVTDYYKRTSPIVLLLAFVLALSAVVIPIFGVYKEIQKYEAGNDEWGFKSPC
jgi:uncharacterized membrane protein YfcA